MCDGGERYLDTYYDPAWVAQKIGDVAPFAQTLDGFL